MTQFLRSPCPLHRLQRTFAVLQRALPGGFCKAGGKIAGIPKAYLLCNFADAVIGEDKQFLCLCDVEVDQIIIRCRAHIPPEQPQKIAFAHVRLCQQVGKAKFLLVILRRVSAACKMTCRALVVSASARMLCAHKASISWRANPVVTMLSTVLSTIWLSPCSNEPRTTQGIKQKISGRHLGTARSVCFRPGL